MPAPGQRSFSYEKAAKMYQDGALVKDIAAQLQTTETSVRRALRLQGVEVVHQSVQRAKANYRRRKYDNGDLVFVHYLRGQGASWREVGRAMEAPFGSIRGAYNRWLLEQLQEKEQRNGAA